jgi:hypothetical protein
VNRRTLLLAVPHVLLFGGMAAMLIVHPNAVRSGVQSTRAIVVNGVLLTGWLVGSFVILPRILRNPLARATILTGIAVAAILVLVVPTLRDKKVVEQFPVAIAEPTTTAPPPPTAMAPGAQPVPTAPITPPTTTVVPRPVRVSSGAVRGIDHDASGTASIYRQPNSTLVVALEDIDIEPGPDYRVVVVPGTDRQSPGDGLELDKLRGNQGTQYYEVPAGTDVGTDWTVLIWCRAFGVPVANATQIAA